MNTEKKRTRNLCKLFILLEKQLKRLKKSRSSTDTPLNEVQPSSSGSDLESPKIANDFERQKLKLYERCEHNITELRRLCWNFEELNEKKITPRRRNYENEQKRVELTSKLKAVMVEERKLLKEIAAKKRELRLLMANDQVEEMHIT